MIIEVGRGLGRKLPWDKFEMAGLKTLQINLQTSQTGRFIQIGLWPWKIGQGQP